MLFIFKWYLKPFEKFKTSKFQSNNIRIFMSEMQSVILGLLNYHVLKVHQHMTFILLYQNRKIKMIKSLSISFDYLVSKFKTISLLHLTTYINKCMENGYCIFFFLFTDFPNDFNFAVTDLAIFFLFECHWSVTDL